MERQRDGFAAAAMREVLRAQLSSPGQVMLDAEDIATNAYAMADAMLQARSPNKASEPSQEVTPLAAGTST